jgi:hypothetical protein
MPSIFGQLTALEVRTYLKRYTPFQRQAQKYYRGDHWQYGEGWIAPAPDKSHELYASTMAQIKRAFISKNSLKEVIKRHIAGVVGKSPAWRFALRSPTSPDGEPTKQEKDFIAATEAAITTWWDNRKIHKLLQDRLVPLLYAGRTVFRIFIPNKRRGEDGTITALTLEQALEHIYIDSPNPEDCTVSTVREYMEPLGVYVYRDKSSSGTEITYLDDEGKTVLKIAKEGITTTKQGNRTTREYTALDKQDEPLTLDLQGHLWMIEIEREPLVSEQVVQNQKLLNQALTMLGRNSVQGGFLERTILNGEMPGEWQTDGDGNKKFVPAPYTVGAGTTNWIQGRTIFDELTNKVTVANPSVVYRDPVAVETFIETARQAYRNILEEVNELHVLISGDATPSGFSRVQARTDFIKELEITAPLVVDTCTWMLEAVLYLAAELSGNDEGEANGSNAGEDGNTTLTYAGLRAVVDVRMDAGQLSAEERLAVLSELEKGAISREKAMVLLGVDDVDAELSKIQAERDSSLEQLTIRAELAQLVDGLVGIAPEILKALKFPDELVKAVQAAQKYQEENPEENPEEEEEDSPDDQEQE